jgi:hypothetical protein
LPESRPTGFCARLTGARWRSPRPASSETFHLSIAIDPSNPKRAVAGLTFRGV